MNHPMADISRPRCAPSAATETPILWGLTPKRIHDRFWTAHGLTTVRCGDDDALGGIDQADDSAVFLLLPHATMILCAIEKQVFRTLKRTPHTCWLDIVDQADDAYIERVETNADGQFVRVTRRYHADPESPPCCRAVLTRDASMAHAWAAAGDDSEALRAVRRSVGPRSAPRSRLIASTFDCRSPEASQGFITALQHCDTQWIDAFPDLTRIGQRIIAHTSAEIDADVRLIAPLWIGAGVQLAADDLAIGPRILEDRIPVQPSLMNPVSRKVRSPQPASTKGIAAKIHPRSRRGKRAFDIAFSLFALAITAPIVPFIMLAIWIEDRRPFIFGQPRQTRDGKDFICYKFRTMCRNAEQMKDQFELENICDGPQFHISHDPRLLRVGKLLRRFHLDELPQFFNVLKGDMHVVGPRPSPDKENQFCPPWRETRLSVKPGMTGLWQVCRTRAPHTDFQEWIRYDLTYVDRENPGLDAWIIVQTLGSLILHKWKKKRIHPAQPRQATEITGEHSSPAQSAPRSVSVFDVAPDPGTPEAPLTGDSTDASQAPIRRRAA